MNIFEIDLDKINVRDDTEICGLARYIMREYNVKPTNVNAGGQSVTAYWGRVLRWIKEWNLKRHKEGID